MARKELDADPIELDFDEEGRAIELEEDDDFKFEDDELEAKPEEESEEEESEEEEETGEKAKRATRAEVDAAEARATEAERVAAAAVQMVEQARQNAAEKPKIAEAKAALVSKVTEVKKKLKEAIEEADSDKQIELNEELADLKGKQHVLNIMEEQQTQAPPQQQTVVPHAKAVAWKSKNAWFDNNQEAHDFALLVAARAVQAGYSPATDHYYTLVDEAMKKRFPELVGGKTEKPEKKVAAPAVKGVERGNPGAVAKRATKVELSPLQVKIAKRWNIPPEEMAKEVLRQQRREGEKK